MDPMQMPTTHSHAELLLMLLTVVAAILTMAGFVLWAAKHAYRERRRLRCPVQHRMTSVLFELAPDARRTDVIRCALLKDVSPISCGKPCLQATGM